MLKHNMRAEQSLDTCQSATCAPLSREVNNAGAVAHEQSVKPNVQKGLRGGMGRVSLKNTNIICGQNKALIHAKEPKLLRLDRSEQNDP